MWQAYWLEELLLKFLTAMTGPVIANMIVMNGVSYDNDEWGKL